MLRYEIVIFWSDEDDLFVAFSPDLIGCMAHGATREEALDSIQEVMAHWIEVAHETGQFVPEPGCRRTLFWPDKAGQSAEAEELAV